MVNDLIKFLDKSVVNFWAADTVVKRLEADGFKYLDAADHWEIVPGGKYYTTQNSSAVFAFVAGTAPNGGAFRIISAHSDSPCFRVKPNCEMVSDGRMLKLNTEVYGGPIMYTWFDRPLSLAGRVILRSDDPLHPCTRLVRFAKPMLTIPHLAIHFNREVNEGNKLSRQKDMLPVVGRLPEGEQAEGWLTRQIAKELNVAVEDILDYDVSLYDTTGACIVGAYDDFITSGRIDDLSMVHAAMSALLNAKAGCPDTCVMAVFDNEETGSGTKQGAASPILDYMLRRINIALGGGEEDYMRAVAKSFMVSADNAHGVHPNYIEKQDPTNHPVLGNGPVIKINARCKYMTDADSAAVFAEICRKADVPVQYFVNHSDVLGGSTLGNILTSQIPLRGVDMGAAIWAMHSARETASVRDHEYIVRAFTQFFNL
ncbi:MAG: M18 family aminopeptidase [Muribaculaceae bacterium]